MPRSGKGRGLKKRTPEQQAKATHTGWIRDLERAMRASTLHPAAKLVYSAMIDHTNAETCMCWASQSSIAIATHLSDTTVGKYQKQLEAGKMIKRRGKSSRGTIRWGFPDAWANGGLDTFTIKLDEKRKKDAKRQARCREKRREKVTQPCLRHETEKSRNDVVEVSRNHGCDKLLKRTPNRTSTEERDNPYARMKGKSVEPKAD